jgi:hypothetical protein
MPIYLKITIIRTILYYDGFLITAKLAARFVQDHLGLTFSKDHIFKLLKAKNQKTRHHMARQRPSNRGKTMSDLINHPPHYTAHQSKIECIEITRHLDFNRGCAIKYLWRCGKNESFYMHPRYKNFWRLLMV